MCIVCDSFNLLINWYRWLDYDFKNNIDSDDYYTYANFRYWLIDELDTWHDINAADLPRIKDESEFTKIWFDVDCKVNKQSLLDVKLGKNYEIKKTYQGICLQLCD